MRTTCGSEEQNLNQGTVLRFSLPAPGPGPAAAAATAAGGGSSSSSSSSGGGDGDEVCVEAIFEHTTQVLTSHQPPPRPASPIPHLAPAPAPAHAHGYHRAHDHDPPFRSPRCGEPSPAHTAC